MAARKPKAAQPGLGPLPELSRTAVQPGGALSPAGAVKPSSGLAPEAAFKGSPPGEPVEERRRGVIDSLATALGKSWARRSREALHHEGRAAAGGWPGTVGEATAYVAQAMLSDQHRLPMLTTAERSLLARQVYASARKEWMCHLDPEPPKQKREL